MTGTIKFVLASASVRRRELSEAFDSPVEAIAPLGEEGDLEDGETPEQLVLRLSSAKAAGVAGRVGAGLVLGADTVVVLDDEVLGKPATPAEAKLMLMRLRGRTHRVVTGVTVLDTESARRRASVRSTEVAMRHYSEAEVDAYVASGEPFDKAGAYAVQDSRFHPADSVLGCYLNVVGLPMCEVAALLEQHGDGPRIRADWRPPAECHDCPLRRTEKVAQP